MVLDAILNSIYCW